MIHLNFTEEEKGALSYERYRHPHHRVRQKMEVLWLKSQNIPHKEIMNLTKLSSTAITNYLKEYQSGGIESLKKVHFNQPKSKLEDFSDILKKQFTDNPVSTIKEAKSVIFELTGISRGLTCTRLFMNKLGFKPRKVGMIPAKANVAVQEEFKKKR